jgi:hypothetical protein
LTNVAQNVDRMRTECGNAEVAPSCPACPAPERRTQLHRRAATPRRLACRLPEGGTRANVAMSDVMRNQGLAAPGPLSQPCRCSPRTARGWPVHFPSPSRFWGQSGKRLTAATSCSTAPHCLSPVQPQTLSLQGLGLSSTRFPKRCHRRRLGGSRFTARSSLCSDPFS